MRPLVLALLIVIGWLHSVHSEESPTFCGKSVGGWIEVVRDQSSDPDRRRLAVWALGCFGPEARSAAPDLIDVLRREPGLEGEAMNALSRIGAGTELLIPPLIERFLNEGSAGLPRTDTSVAYTHAMEPLCRIGEAAVPALLKIFKDRGREGYLQRSALEALGEIGPAARGAVPALIRAVEATGTDEEAKELRRQAIRTLGRIGPDAKAAIPVLSDLLGHDDLQEFDAVIALERIGAPPVRKLLDGYLRTGDELAAAQLIGLGTRAREAAPALRQALKDKATHDPLLTAAIIASIEPEAPEVMPELIAAVSRMGDQAGDMRNLQVFGALARRGPRAEAALPALIARSEGYKEPDLFKTLVQVDPEGKQCVPVLISALRRGDHRIVATAADCLGLLGSRAKAAVPALAVALLRDFVGVAYDGIDPQASAAKALQRIGPDAKSAISVLIEALKFRHLDPLLLEGQVGRRNSAAAVAAALTLGSFRDEAKSAVPGLIEVLQSREDPIETYPLRQAAALALGQIGPAARPAVPVLRKLRAEPGPDSLLVPEPEFIVALFKLSPDGPEVADRWLAEPLDSTDPDLMNSRFVGRTMVLGAIGRASLEGDWLTRRRLERLDSMRATADPLMGDVDELLRRPIEEFGRFGVASRLAVPRLNEFRESPNPWVRIWAAEALRQIVPGPPRSVE